MLFALSNWVLNLFILFVEIYVSFPTFIDKLISANALVEVGDAILDIPVVWFLSSSD